MADQPPARDDREARTERPSSPSTVRPDHEHPKGWRVQPAPDGRGMPPQKPPGLRALGPRFIWFVVILLALNLWITSLIPSTHERVRIPYSPTFLTEVKGGNVKSISSRGATVQGEFRHEFKYPPTGKGSKVSKLFDTEVPTFANTDQLSGVLQAHGVQVNAKPAEQGRSFLANLLLGFGPTLLLVGLFVWFARRAARQGAGGGLLGGLGRSGARRVEPSEQTVTFDDVAAIGRARTAGSSFGGNDEREQTLNQILTEMDGFDTSIGVIVLAATNRPEILDPALLRPGRFDRRVAVQPPDTAGRRKILEVHTRSVPLADDVDIDTLASTTVGMVGADLANLVNEAALMAARREHDQVTMSDFTDALERLVLGSERKIVQSEADRQRTAYHEAGHALVGMLTPGADPVRKVSIIPRGPALGVTLSSPAADRFSYDISYLLARIKVHP